MATDEVAPANFRNSHRLSVFCSACRTQNDAKQETHGFKGHFDPLQRRSSRLLDIALYNGMSKDIGLGSSNHVFYDIPIRFYDGE